VFMRLEYAFTREPTFYKSPLNPSFYSRHLWVKARRPNPSKPPDEWNVDRRARRPSIARTIDRTCERATATDASRGRIATTMTTAMTAMDDETRRDDDADRTSETRGNGGNSSDDVDARGAGEAMVEAMKYVYDPNREGSGAFAGANATTTRARPTCSLKVMQFNALADALAANDAFASAAYYEDDETETGNGNDDGGEETATTSTSVYDLNFRKRGRDLIRVVSTGDASTAPDVVCLQEVDHYYDFFEPEMRKLGYAGIYKEDQWSPCRKFDAPNDGVAIFYKMDKLELLSSHAPGCPRPRKDDAVRDAGKTLMARFRLKKDPKSDSMMRKAFGSLMRVASSNAKPVFSGEDLREVVVVTTHLASEKTVDGIITRLEQTKELCRQLNAFATNLCSDVDGVQIILAGDLNATPNEACVVHLRGRGMRNAYEDMSAALGDEKANRFTTWKTRTGVFKAGEVKHTIDYILYSAHRGSKVVSVAKLPNESDIPGDKGLPTFGFPSDHLPLQAVIAFPT